MTTVRTLLKTVTCIACLALSGCASQVNLSEEFDRSVKAYNRMLRWHELENAVMVYSNPEHREESLKQAEALKKKGLSITDFRILSTRFIPEKKSGDVVSEFDYYILPSNRIKTITNRQQWLYRDELKSWQLAGGLPAFE